MGEAAPSSMVHMKRLTTWLAWLITISGLACAPGQADGKTPTGQRQKRVLLVAIDGLRPDGLLAHAPRLRRYGQQHLHTWSSTVAIPISAPSWCTIFSGLSFEHTGVTNNAFTGSTLSPKDNRLASGKAKTVFNLLRENDVSYAVVSTGTWDGIETIANYNNGPNPHNRWVKSPNNRPRNELAAQVQGIEAVTKLMNETATSVLVFYTHHVDNAGHMFGHDPEVVQYAKAIRETDANVDTLLQQVEERKRRHNEDWLVLITTDHGGSSRWKLEQSTEGLGVLAKMDADKQINAGIPQVHLEGVHGLRQDAVIDHEQTTTFIIMNKGARTGFVGAGKTNREITPTVIEFVLPNSPALLAGLDGKPLGHP